MLNVPKEVWQYKDTRELGFYFMFVATCLPDDKKEILKAEWERQGGVKNMPWWQFIQENTVVDIDIQQK